MKVQIKTGFKKTELIKIFKLINKTFILKKNYMVEIENDLFFSINQILIMCHSIKVLLVDDVKTKNNNIKFLLIRLKIVN